MATRCVPRMFSTEPIYMYIYGSDRVRYEADRVEEFSSVRALGTC